MASFFTPVISSIAWFQAMTLPSRSMANVASGRNSMIWFICCSDSRSRVERNATTPPTRIRRAARGRTLRARWATGGEKRKAVTV
ncbi:MAG: hypothetical protein BWX50_00676 [Euryarchaeota archaeon ADurb.Bin009]|nr:MAG: hypothetical protein BWX50_00676 [Euryarchaeota archaeon ADurb.Bin009]